MQINYFPAICVVIIWHQLFVNVSGRYDSSNKRRAILEVVVVEGSSGDINSWLLPLLFSRSLQDQEIQQQIKRRRKPISFEY